MTLSKLSIQKDSQGMRLCLSIAAVIAATPLALGAKAPAQTTPPNPPTIKLASHTAAPGIPFTISLHPLGAQHNDAQNNSLVDDTVGVNLDTEQTDRGTAQDTSDEQQSETSSTKQEARTAAPEAARPTAVTPPTTTQTTPAAGGTSASNNNGTDDDKVSSPPTTTSTTTTPQTQTVVTTNHRSSTEETAPSTSSDTTNKEIAQLSRTQVQTQVQAPAPLRQLL